MQLAAVTFDQSIEEQAESCCTSSLHAINHPKQHPDQSHPGKVYALFDKCSEDVPASHVLTLQLLHACCNMHAGSVAPVHGEGPAAGTGQHILCAAHSRGAERHVL